MTDADKLAFVQSIAERILFSHASDIEYLSICEMTADDVRYGSEEIQAAYPDGDEFDALIDAVDEKVSSAIVGISWDEGVSWQW